MGDKLWSQRQVEDLPPPEMAQAKAQAVFVGTYGESQQRKSKSGMEDPGKVLCPV